jgi:hypothetical protein
MFTTQQGLRSTLSLSNFGPEDINAMCAALKRTCTERGLKDDDFDGREKIARVVLVQYRPGMSEDDIVTAAGSIARHVG